MSTEFTKRAISAGLGIGALALLAPRASADTPFTSYPFPAAGAPTPRTMPDRLSDVRNVKDFGAIGNGVADDTAAIQATFDAAFGSASNPHGNANRFLNRPVFFPAGRYKVTSTLRLTKVVGGHIFGSGSQSTQIYYAGPIDGTNITSLILTNGFSYSRVEGLDMGISGPQTVVFYLFWDGTTGGSACNANTFIDLTMGSATTGCLIGYNGEMGSENVFQNVTFTNCSHAGLKTANANALDQTVIGGGAAQCGTGYFASLGSIPAIINASFANNTLDIANNNGVASAVIGCRSESPSFVSSNAWMHLTGCHHHALTVGAFAHTHSSGTIIMDACRSISGIITGSGNSRIYIRGSTFENVNYLSSFTGRVAQNI